MAVDASHINDPQEIFKTLDMNRNGAIEFDEVKQSKHYLRSMSCQPLIHNMLNIIKVIFYTQFIKIIISEFILSGWEKINATYLFVELDINHNGIIERYEIDDSLQEL